jgi:hypothetical protein
MAGTQRTEEKHREYTITGLGEQLAREYFDSERKYLNQKK